MGNNIYIIIIPIVLSIAQLIVSRTTLANAVKRLNGIILIAIILQAIIPIVDIVNNTTFFPNDNDDEIVDTTVNDEIIKAIAGELCNEIEVLVRERFSLSENDFDVAVTLNTEEIDSVRLKTTVIKLKSLVSEKMASAISEYVASITSAPCTVLTYE